MKIDMEKSLELPLAPDLAWVLLQDIATVAACLPGAKITERIDETHYKGTVSVKLGPATVAFKGTIEIVSLEPETRRMRIVGKGSDAGNTSGASLDLLAWIEPRGSHASLLSGRSELSVNGKVAAFGARLMDSVSAVLIKQFFDNMLAQATAMQPAVAVVDRQSEPLAYSPPPVSVTPKAPAGINIFSFLWAVIREFSGGLFGRRKPT